MVKILEAAQASDMVLTFESGPVTTNLGGGDYPDPDGSKSNEGP